MTYKPATQAERGAGAIPRAHQIERPGIALRIAPDAVPLPEQEVDCDVEGLLGAARDDDVLGIDLGAPADESRSDPRAQPFAPLRPAVLEALARRHPHHPGERAGERRPGEQIVRGETSREHDHVGLGRGTALQIAAWRAQPLESQREACSLDVELEAAIAAEAAKQLGELLLLPEPLEDERGAP